MPAWQELFLRFDWMVGCGHPSGLLARVDARRP